MSRKVSRVSAILWSGDRLIQHVGGHDEELGCIRFDKSSKSYVLRLKDTSGVTGNAGGRRLRPTCPA